MNSAFFKRVRQYRAKARSQAFVEFSMILPIFLTLMCGVIDYGFMIGNSMSLAMAAREGANAGSRSLNDQMSNGLYAAVAVARPRIKLYSSSGGAIITKVLYHPTLSTQYAYLYDTATPGNACQSTGSIYGGNDSLKNKSRILSGLSTNGTYWMTPTRKLPMPLTVLAADDQSMVIMEVFYTNLFVTPIGSLIGMVTPSVLYDVALF